MGNQEEINATFSRLRDEVKARYRIDTALQDVFGISLQGNGDNRQACCPFHVEKTPSFHVSVSKGRYRCFGSGCEESGDVFKLIMDTQSLSFRDALLWGADRAGVTVPDEIRSARGNRPRTTPSAVRKVEPVNPIMQIPGHLKSPEFIHVENRTRRPRAKQLFRAWQDGGKNKDKAFRDVFYRPEMVHEYRDFHGNLLMSVLRERLSDGRKLFIPVRIMPVSELCPSVLVEHTRTNGERLAWVNEGPADGARKPIYGMERVQGWIDGGGTNILLVEGEKTCDAAERMIAKIDKDANWLVLSPMGGSSATVYADWKPLMDMIVDRNINVTTWPDADKPLQRRDGTTVDRQDKYVRQMMTSFMQGALDAGLDAAQFTISHVTPPQNVESGWDIADAETDGWMPEQLLGYLAANTKEIDMAALNLRAVANNSDADLDVMAEEDLPAPFEIASPAEGDDAIWHEIENGTPTGEIDSELVDGETQYLDVDNASSTQDEIIATLGIDTDIVEVTAVTPPPASDTEGSMIEEPVENPMLSNRHFRCLGYRDQVDYFMSLTSGQVFGLAPRQLKQEYLLHLAPLEWWTAIYGRTDPRGNANGVDWTRASNDLIQNCYAAGVWDPRLQVVQGARIDGRKVVFNTGSRLYIEGRDGTSPLWDFMGRYCYTMGPSTRTPAFDAPFEADSAEIKEFLNIIKSIDWRGGTKEISVLSLFGWIMISPICGILKWRPHLWLDGPRSSGKSWIVNNIVLPALGDYAEQVVSNSSESGIRNLLNNRSIPIIFDEAEGEGQADRIRMDAILRLARHSATESDSVVAQGVSGGGASRHFSMASTFLMTSIMPQLEAAADKTRFARARLGSGRGYEEFTGKIENPAYELLQEPKEIDGNLYSFSDRLVARMVMRGNDYEKVYRMMVQAFSRMGHERRVSDVYGTFAAGAWLALRDDVPEAIEDAVMWIAEVFNVMAQISEMNADLKEEKDHLRVFREISVQDIRFDTRNAGTRTYQIGDLIAVASGHPGEDDVVISAEEAREHLRRLGIKPGLDSDSCPVDVPATHLLVHRNSPALRNMMEKTPYARSFIDVMHQAEEVTICTKAHRFGPSLGPASKPLVVPIAFFISGKD